MSVSVSVRRKCARRRTAPLSVSVSVRRKLRMPLSALPLLLLSIGSDGGVGARGPGGWLEAA
eukprot:6040616-Prymnesium_polylepis.1